MATAALLRSLRRRDLFPAFKSYRECIILGETDLTKTKVNQILGELSTEWPGDCYDLLSKNCNHFCDEFCERLGVPKLPGWVNRFANAGDTAVEIAGNTAYRGKDRYICKKKWSSCKKLPIEIYCRIAKG